MDSQTKFTRTDPVTDARRRVEVWRRTRPTRGPMPAKLWEEAAQLAGVHGINPIARALGLEYYALKRHLETTRRCAETTRPAFVEVSVVPPTLMLARIVELERPDGARMKIQLSCRQDLVAVTESFWRCRA